MLKIRICKIFFDNRFIIVIILSIAGCEVFLSDLNQVPVIQLGDFKLRLELDDELSPELQAVAENELRENPEQQEKSIAELKALLEGKRTAHRTAQYLKYANPIIIIVFF